MLYILIALCFLEGDLIDENNKGHSSEYYITLSVKQESVYLIRVACIETHTHIHSVYRGRLTLAGELSAVTRLRMTSMAAKREIPWSLYLHVSREKTVARGEGKNAAFREHLSLSKLLQ